MSECADKTLKHKKRPIKNIRRTQNPGIMKCGKHWKDNSSNLLNMFKNFEKNLHTLGQYNKKKTVQTDH